MNIDLRERFAWITERQDILRWATVADLPAIIDIYQRAFQRPGDPKILYQLWLPKIDVYLLAVLEVEGKILGFRETLWGPDPWRPPHGLPMRYWLREWAARKVVCHPGYSRDGPYGLLTARHPDAPPGTGAAITRAVLRHHDRLSLLCERQRLPLRQHYERLGFVEEEPPIPWLLRQYVQRRYVFYVARVN